MAGLILKLRPHEQLLINGVVVENGERNARLNVKTEGAHILRLRDAMKPEEATTPLKRAYYVAQLAVAGQIDAAEAAAMLRRATPQLAHREQSAHLAGLIAQNEFYQVMRYLKEIDKGKAALAETIMINGASTRRNFSA